MTKLNKLIFHNNKILKKSQELNIDKKRIYSFYNRWTCAWLLVVRFTMTVWGVSMYASRHWWTGCSGPAYYGEIYGVHKRRRIWDTSGPPQLAGDIRWWRGTHGRIWSTDPHQRVWCHPSLTPAGSILLFGAHVKILRDCLKVFLKKLFLLLIFLLFLWYLL